MTIPLALPLPTGSSCQPGPLGLKRPLRGGIPKDQPRARPLFGIAPGGACRAGPVARPAVGSYPTVSPLPRERGGLFSVALSLGLPRPGVARHRCFMESGLSSHVRRRKRSSSHPRAGLIQWRRHCRQSFRGTTWGDAPKLSQKRLISQVSDENGREGVRRLKRSVTSAGYCRASPAISARSAVLSGPLAVGRNR